MYQLLKSTVALIGVLLLAPVVTAGERVSPRVQRPPVRDWEATPGVELTAEKFVPEHSPPYYPMAWRGLPTYRFKVTGSPTGTRYRLWQKNMGEEPSSLAIESEYFVVDDQGYLLLRVDDAESRVQMSLREFSPGQSIEYCLASIDGRIRAFEKVIPIPVEATNDAGYRITMILSDPRSYTIVLDGFEPNQEVEFSADEGRFIDATETSFDAKTGMGISLGDAKPGQRVGMIVGWHAPRFLPGGSSEITVRGESGELKIEFNWGTANPPPRTVAREHLQRAAADYYRERYAEALHDLDKAIEVDPTYLQAFLLRGVILLAFEPDYRRAFEDLSEAIRIDPTCWNPYYFRGRLQSIYPDADLRDGERAVTDLTRACELTNWEDAHCVADLGAAYAELGDFDQAIKWQSKAMEMSPNDQEFLDHGKIRLQLYRQETPFRLPAAVEN